MTIKEQAQQLIELNQKRTPGEWCIGTTPINITCGNITLCSMAGALSAHEADFYNEQRDNATFIAHTANHAPAIAQAYLDKCEEVEMLREARDDWAKMAKEQCEQRVSLMQKNERLREALNWVLDQTVELDCMSKPDTIESIVRMRMGSECLAALEQGEG